MDANTIDVFHHNNVTCKIDKVCLHGHAKEDILQDDIEALVVQNVQNSHYRYMYKHFTSDQPNKYARLHNISYYEFYENGTHEEFTIAILIGFNGPNMCGTEEEQHRFVIEFNPQKFKCPKWLTWYFQKRGYIVEYVNNIDLAMDFRGYPRSRFRYVVNNGNTVTTSTGTASNKTDYIGKEKSNNRIKIYDKKKERAKYFEMEEETTRVEITLLFTYYFYKKDVEGEDMKYILAASDAISQVFVAGESSSDPFVYALSCLSQDQLNSALSLMSVNTRGKYKKLLKQAAEAKLCCDSIELIFFLKNALRNILWDNGIYYKKAWIGRKNEVDYASLAT